MKNVIALITVLWVIYVIITRTSFYNDYLIRKNKYGNKKNK